MRVVLSSKPFYNTAHQANINSHSLRLPAAMKCRHKSTKRLLMSSSTVRTHALSLLLYTMQSASAYPGVGRRSHEIKWLKGSDLSSQSASDVTTFAQRIKACSICIRFTAWSPVLCKQNRPYTLLQKQAIFTFIYPSM